MRDKPGVEVVLHNPEEEAPATLAAALEAFYLELVDSRMTQAGLEANQKVAVLDLILKKRKVCIDSNPP